MSTTAADGSPRGVAGRTQAVDVYSSSTITTGGFRLSYGGNDNIITPCIPANATALTADVVANALSSANSFLNVTVDEDDPPFDGARRFVVYFNEPEIGVGVLGVVDADDEDEECEWLQCWSSGGDDDEEDGACEESGVLVNREMSVFVEEGAVEVRTWGWLQACAQFMVSSKRTTRPTTLVLKVYSKIGILQRVTLSVVRSIFPSMHTINHVGHRRKNSRVMVIVSWWKTTPKAVMHVTYILLNSGSILSHTNNDCGCAKTAESITDPVLSQLPITEARHCTSIWERAPKATNRAPPTSPSPFVRCNVLLSTAVCNTFDTTSCC